MTDAEIDAVTRRVFGTEKGVSLKPMRAYARAVLAAQPAPVPEEFDMADDGGCPVCGEDGGTSCGMPNCGLLSAAPVPAPAEPVAWMLDTTDGKLFRATDSKHNDDWLPLYTAPPAPVPVPLTDEQIDAMWRQPMSADWEHREFARAIEAHHGIVASPEVP